MATCAREGDGPDHQARQRVRPEPAPGLVGPGPRAVGAQRWRVLRRALGRPRRLLGGLIAHAGEDDLFTHAAALAFYFFFSLFPFLLFLLALVTMLPGAQGLEEWLLAQAGHVVPPDAYETVEGVVRSLLAQPRRGLLSLGAGLALWSASTAVVGVMHALNAAYGVPERRAWWRVRLIAIGLVVAMSFFMVLAFVLAVSSGPLSVRVATLLGPAGGVALLIGHWLVSLAAITLVTATIYRVCPDVHLPWRWFSPGSTLFTLGFVLTTIGFSYYVTHFGSYDRTYGSLGAVIILLLWMYLIAFLLLLGGEVNALLDRIAAEDGEAAPAAADREGDDDEGDSDLPAWAREELE